MEKLLTDEYKSQLRKIYSVEKDWVHILQALDISADEFENGQLEDISEASTNIFGIEITSSYEQREFMLTCMRRFYKNDDIHWVERLISEEG